MYQIVGAFFWLLLIGLAWILLKTKALSWLQALRGPLLLWAAVTGVAVLGFCQISLARGLFWFGRGGAFGVCTLAFFAGWQCLFLGRLIRAYGPARLPGYAAGVANEPALWEYSFCAVPGLATIAAIVRNSWLGSSSDSKVWLLAAMIAGLLFAAVLALFVASIQRWSQTAGTPRLNMTTNFPFLEELYNRPPPAWLKRFSDAISFTLRSVITSLDPLGGAGYLKHRGLEDGHVAAAVMSLVTAGFALVYFFGYHLGLSGFQPGAVPAAIYLYLMFTVLAWIVCALCFFLDGLRVPTLTVLALWAWVVTFNPLNQHYFELKARSPRPLPTPADAGNTHKIAGKRRWVIVSADGGGIQAAAWSAQVLGGIAEDLGAPFGNSIAMMSGVSGGSAGLMFFSTLYGQNGFEADKGRIERVIQASRAKAQLADAAFGLAFYDFSRPFIPFVIFGKNDRGVLLERAWKRDLEEIGAKGEITLGDMRQGVVEGTRPAFLFNSTVADTGQAFVLSNTTFPLPPESEGGSTSFEKLYPDRDLTMVTAVRMSATFPFVSPASKPSQGSVPYAEQPYAFVDGGYYDNYGVVNALAWLRDAAKNVPTNEDRPEIFWLQIRSSTPDPPVPDKLATSEVGPVDTLYKTRGTAQRSRAGQLDEMVLRAAPKLGIRICVPPPFEFPKSDVPLSWVLSNSDQIQIGFEWGRIRSSMDSTLRQLRSFVSGSPMPDCATN